MSPRAWGAGVSRSFVCRSVGPGRPRGARVGSSSDELAASPGRPRGTRVVESRRSLGDLEACSAFNPGTRLAPGSYFDSSTFSSRHAWLPGDLEPVFACSLETRLDPRSRQTPSACNARRVWLPGPRRHTSTQACGAVSSPRRARTIEPRGAQSALHGSGPPRLDIPDTSHTTHRHPDVLEPRLDLDPGPLALHAPTQPRQHGGSMERCGGAVLVRDGRVRGRVLFGRGTI